MSRMLDALRQLQCDAASAGTSVAAADSSSLPPVPAAHREWEAASYEHIVQEICSQPGLQHGGVLLFTSVEQAEHAAGIAARLAGLLSARGDGEVLLADANFSSRVLTRGYRAEQSPGLGEMLAGTRDWRNDLLPTPGSEVRFLGSGLVEPPCHAAAQARLAYALDHWVDQFCFVLIDSGRVADPFTRTLSRLCSAVYLVVQLQRTDSAEASAAVRTLCQTDARLRGCVVVRPAR